MTDDTHLHQHLRDYLELLHAIPTRITVYSGGPGGPGSWSSDHISEDLARKAKREGMFAG
jgi:hypothetical protein